MDQVEIFYFFYPQAVCSRVRKGDFDVLENLHVKRKAEASKAKNEPAPAGAKTSAVQFDLWAGERGGRRQRGEQKSVQTRLGRGDRPEPKI